LTLLIDVIICRNDDNRELDALHAFCLRHDCINKQNKRDFSQYFVQDYSVWCSSLSVLKRSDSLRWASTTRRLHAEVKTAIRMRRFHRMIYRATNWWSSWLSVLCDFLKRSLSKRFESSWIHHVVSWASTWRLFVRSALLNI
jgi:hypothetical protein